MGKRTWIDGIVGGTALSAARLNPLESDIDSALTALARTPEALFAGSISVDANGAPISAVVQWPDGVTGTYAGTASTAFPGSVDAYTITRPTTPFVTYTQPTVTRDAAGNITNRPAITVS